MHGSGGGEASSRLNYEDMQLRGLASTTQRSYIHYIADYAKFYNTSPENLDLEAVRQYELYLLHERKLVTGLGGLERSFRRLRHNKQNNKDLTTLALFCRIAATAVSAPVNPNGFIFSNRTGPLPLARISPVRIHL
jgi:hypothetical protein